MAKREVENLYQKGINLENKIQKQENKATLKTLFWIIMVGMACGFATANAYQSGQCDGMRRMVAVANEFINGFEDLDS